MLNICKSLLTVLGLSAIIIGLMIFILGPNLTAQYFGAVLEMAFGVNGYSGGLEHVNVDSEMRFYSVFWIAYGCLLIWLVPKLEERPGLAFLAIGLFFAGGLGRGLSYHSYGRPDMLFHVLMVLEIIGSTTIAVIFALSLRTKR